MTGVRVLVVDVLGTAVRVTVPDDVGAEVERVFSDLGRPTSTAAPRHLALERRYDGRLRLLDDGEVVLDPVEPALAAATVAWRLNAVAAATTGHVVLHAGCVSSDGGAVVLPGPSEAGKSTLTAAALADGFAYLTDEHAALSLGTGLLEPFAKPLDLGERGLVPASSLGPGRLGRACAPVGAVFPRYAAGRPTASIALDPATALLALCAQATNLPAVGAAGFAALAGLADAVPAWQVTYGSTTGAVEALHHAVDHAPPARAVVPAPLAPPVTPTTATVVLGEGSVVVLDETTWGVHRFNASAGLVWLCAGETRDRDELVALVRSESPGGAVDTDQIGATLDHLAAIGLLGTVAR